ncbi:hypothetical protein [Streptomyces longisporoflavus]|uniref:hypothetical protein n=1 Tax=Streptomyces longisporoflavus TaxID=28044 RepID=UPI00167F0C7D|nr:hypothetical protein [Streptomyces longisporoflavus]
MAEASAWNPVTFAVRQARSVLGIVDEAASTVIRGLAAAVLDRMDLDDLVSRVDVNGIVARVDIRQIVERVDVDAIADRVDVERVADRVDVNRVADRVDVQRVVDRVDVDAIAGRVDVNAVADRIDVDRVAGQVDVNRIAARVDVDAVIVRIDLVALTREVLSEIDLGRIVRDTGGGMAAETTDAVRLLGRRGDRSANRFGDLLLRRAGPARDEGAGPPAGRAR